MKNNETLAIMNEKIYFITEKPEHIYQKGYLFS